MAAVAALVATSGGRMSATGVRELRLRRVWERAHGLLAAMASWRVVTFLLERKAWAEISCLAVGRAREREVVLSEGEACSALLLACGGLGIVGGLASGSPVGSVALAGLGVIGVRVLASANERRHAHELSESMPGIFRTLAIALGSGQTLTQAIDYVGSHERGPAAREFARTSLRLRCGIPAEEALSLLCEELEAPGVGLLVTALLISQRTGSPLRDLFQRSAALVERQGEFERTLSVKTAQVRLSVRIVCLLPVLMIALLSLISQDFQAGLASLAGTLSVALALAMDAAALLIIRRLLKGVL